MDENLTNNRVARPSDSELMNFMPRFISHANRRDAIELVVPQKVGRLVMRAFHLPRPGRILRRLSDIGALSPWMQELSRADEIPAGPPAYHHGSLLDHTCEVMNSVQGDSLIVWMAMCHDIGKTVSDPELLPHHYGHDMAGMPMAESMGCRMRLPYRYVVAGATASRWHMSIRHYSDLRAGTKVKLLLNLHRNALIQRMFKLVVADGGPDFLLQAKSDLKRVLSTKLPPNKRKAGVDAIDRLYQARCFALAR